MKDIAANILNKLPKGTLVSLVLVMGIIFINDTIEKYNTKQDETSVAINEIKNGINQLTTYTKKGIDSLHTEISYVKIENKKLADKFTVYSNNSNKEIQKQVTAIDELYKKAIEISQIRNTSFEYIEPIKQLIPVEVQKDVVLASEYEVKKNRMKVN